jgi:hypothetical protein
MRVAMEMAGYDELRREQAEKRAKGEYMGIGISFFTEGVGAGPRRTMDILGLGMADGIELGAVERMLGNAASKTAMSSTKSSIGHLLGAAGSVEAIFCLLAMRDGIVPPTINLDNPDVTTQIDLVPNKAQKRDVNIAMSNSFGFGGTNAALIVSKI